MNLTPEQLQSNYNKFIDNIKNYITGDRQQQLINFYQDIIEIREDPWLK